MTLPSSRDAELTGAVVGAPGPATESLSLLMVAASIGNHADLEVLLAAGSDFVALSYRCAVVGRVMVPGSDQTTGQSGS